MLSLSACRSAACRRRSTCRSRRSPSSTTPRSSSPSPSRPTPPKSRTRSMRRPRTTRPKARARSRRARMAPTSSAWISPERSDARSLSGTGEHVTHRHPDLTPGSPFLLTARRQADPGLRAGMTKEPLMPSNTRTETDSFGPIDVPADAYWGAQTERSIGNFPFGPREQMPLEIIHALGLVKQAAARVNARIGGLDPKLAEVIQQAAGEVARGDLDSQFPLVIWQTGSGTQSNMNANEVIAGRANEKLSGNRGGKEPVHPNDHVNKSQSSNDSFPTALHVAAALAVNARLLPALKRMHQQLADQSKRWDSIVKIGRTHLQDATPLTLGQEFSGYAAQIEDCIARVEGVVPRVMRLAQGGTAVGTGLNAPKGFAEDFAKEISNLTRLPFTSALNKFAELAAHDT